MINMRRGAESRCGPRSGTQARPPAPVRYLEFGVDLNRDCFETTYREPIVTVSGHSTAAPASAAGTAIAAIEETQASNEMKVEVSFMFASVRTSSKEMKGITVTATTTATRMRVGCTRAYNYRDRYKYLPGGGELCYPLFLFFSFCIYY